MTTPPLPEPWREDADGEPHYTIVQVIEYGEACRAAALEDVAQICNEEKRATFSGNSITYVSGYNDGCEDCESAIRRLKLCL